MSRVFLTVMLLVLPSAAFAGEKKAGKSRTFFFTYGVTVKGVPADKAARIWLPVPADSPEQKVALEVRELPRYPRYGRDSVYGNRILHLETKPDKTGRIQLLLTYKVTRSEVSAGRSPAKEERDKIQRFLQPDNKVPIGGKPLELLGKQHVPADPMAAARLFFDVVNRHMRYSKEGVGWGRGDAAWACDSRYGNCSDFHSLFISLARSHKLPAKFEIGFSLPPQRGAGQIAGYHCWAWFLPPDKGWVPVDISEAKRHPEKAAYYFGNLTEDRIALSVGRDINLEPRQKGPPLNFFVYPYVEVDGQALAAEKVESVFSFQDIPSGK